MPLETPETSASSAIPHEIREIRGYRLRDLLGAGAMGAVYRAAASGGRRRLRPGEEVAIKILDPRFTPDADIIRRFKREAGLGLELTHPGLARVYEVGSLRLARDRRLHYIVQELLTGSSLRTRLDLEGPQPEPVIREVGRQIAEALAFVHGKSIVHRDLKPANLFLDERGQVKLVDFGLARLLSEPLLDAARASSADAPSGRGAISGTTSTGKFLGTVAYAAPEQLAGAAAMPQSDLFALGLVLHEMATGVHPYARELDQGYDAYVAALQSSDAPLLTELKPELSWFLDRVVQLLLERDPSLRFESAAAVVDAFTLGERSNFWREATSPTSLYVSSSRRRLQVRRATRLLGRTETHALLADEVRAAFAGRARRVVIEGETGFGATRLVDALADWLERSGLPAYFLVARATGSNVTLAPLRELLADACGLDEVATREAQVVRARAQIAELLPGEPERRERLEAFLLEGAPPAAEQLAPLRSALVDLLYAVAGEAPLLLVLDGAEQADAETLRVLEALQPEQHTGRLLLLLTQRTDVAPPEATAPLLHALRRDAALLSLGSLDVGHFGRMWRDLGYEPVPNDKAARRLHELAAGNPGVGLELAAWLDGRHELAALTGRRIAITALPPNLGRRYGGRIAALGAQELELLEAAAVLGTDLRTQTLRDLLGLEPSRFDRLLEGLERERRLVHEEGGVLRFREPLLRRWLVARTRKERRQALHLQAARHYHRESTQAHPAPRTTLKAAIHAELAGEREILSLHLRGAVRLFELEGHAERSWRLVTSAERLARQAPADVRLLATALVLRGQLAHRLGRREDELTIWTEAAKLATQVDDPVVRAHAFHGLGRLSSRTGRFLAAEAFLRKADESAQRAPRGSGVERTLILLDLAETLLWSGDEERCAQALAQAEQVIDAGAAISSIGRYFKERGNLLLELERFDEAEEAFSQGRAIVRGPALRPLHRALVLGSARLLREVADYEKARRAAELARESAESDLDLRHLAQAWYLLGDIEARAGNPDAAFLPYVRALRLAMRIDDDYLAVNALGSLSLLYRWKRFRRHSLAKAVRFARRTIARAHALAVGRLEARGLVGLALCYRDMGKLSWARAIAEKAIREGSAAGVRRRRAAEIYYVHGKILGEMGRTDEARASLEEARRRIELRLLGVASEDVRARMRQRDPLLREIDALRF